jgi:hypothetical protein
VNEILSGNTDFATCVAEIVRLLDGTSGRIQSDSILRAVGFNIRSPEERIRLVCNILALSPPSVWAMIIVSSAVSLSSSSSF